MNKQIQWYPGHMSKSLREINENIKIIDILFILLDARIPISSMNPKILTISKKVPSLILFNKSSLGDENQINKFKNYYEKLGFHTLEIDSISGKNINKIYPKVKEILKDKIDRRLKRGLKEVAFNTMIVGVPNVGKSTLINKLSNKKATKTANRPGVTKHLQWIKLNENFNLLDTPGVLWPKFEDEKVGYNLAITGGIKDEILPLDDVVCYLISYLEKYYQNSFFNRYQITEKLDGCVSYLNHIGEVRKAYLKKGEYDYERIYMIILTDVRNNFFGGLNFDQDFII